MASIEKKIKTDIYDFIRYNSMFDTKYCQYKLYCSELPNLEGWELCVPFMSNEKSKRYNVNMMFFCERNDDGLDVLRFVPIKNKLSLEQTEMTFAFETEEHHIEVDDMYNPNNAYAKAIEFQYKLMFNLKFCEQLFNILRNYWYEKFGG